MKPKVPAILVAAFALDFLLSIANIVVQLSSNGYPDFDHVDRWRLAENGAWIMTLTLMAVGLRDLADRVWGGANRMAKAGSVLVLLILATHVVISVVSAMDLTQSRMFWEVQSYVYWGLGSALLVVLFLAGDRKGLAIAGLLLALLVRMPQFVMNPVWEALSLGYRSSMAVHSVIAILHSLGTLMLVMAIAVGVPAHVPQRAASGFRRAGSGFTLRVVAAAVSILLVMLAIGASSGEGLVKFALLGGLFINMLACALIGLGALDASRASLAGLAKPVLILSGAGSLWCAGVMFTQLPDFYQLLYGDHHRSRDALQALSLALPIVGALATAVLATAIGGFGRARGDDALASSGTASGVGYLALTLAAIGMQNYLFEHVRSKGSAIMLLLAAAAAGLVAQVIMGRLCRRAAEAVEAEPGLAPARLNT